MATHSERSANRARAMDRLREGGSPAEVAVEFNLSVKYVEQLASASGVRLVRQPADLTATTYDIIAALLTGDDRFEDIGARANVSFQRVGQIYKKCIEHGIPVRPRRRGRRPNREDS